MADKTNNTAPQMAPVKKTRPKVVKMPLVKIIPASVIDDWISLNYGDSFRRNEITGEIEISGKPQTEQPLNGLYQALTIDADGGEKVSITHWWTFINSSLVPSYNPVSAFFEGLPRKADTGFISKLAKALKADPEQKMTDRDREDFLTKWLVGMVAAWFDQNYNPLLFILCGPKNSGKTEFFRRLLPEDLKKYFAETDLRAGKDDEAKACENLLLLVDEMDFLTKKDASELRRFLSANIFTYRAPYGRKNQKHKRYATLCGTSNEMEVITDRGNNRRLIPVCITAVDHVLYNSIDKTNLFAEAYQLYRAGYNWNLTRDEIARLETATESNEAATSESELLSKYFTPGDEFLTASEILTAVAFHHQKIPLSKVRMGKALKECGFKRISRRAPGAAPVYGWLVQRVDAAGDFDELL